MRRLLIFCFALVVCAGLYAQNTDSDTANDNKIYTVVEVKPKCKVDINTYLVNHINYPEKAKDNNIQGTVWVKFVVEKDGSISNASVLKGVANGKALEDEAIRLTNAMPRWNPGMQNGHAVRVQFVFPIRFVLADTPLSIQDLKSLNPYAKDTTYGTPKVEKYDTIYSVVQQQPKFPGDLQEWLGDNIRYPKAKEIPDNEQDTIYVSLLIEKDGSVSNVKIVNGIGSSLDREILRAVYEMPKWIPGTQNGKTVRVQYIFAIHYIIKEDENNNTVFKLITKNDTILARRNIDSVYYSRAIGKIYGITINMPEFVGNMREWLQSNIKYPQIPLDAGIQGTVYISFVVGKDGIVSSVQVSRGVNKYLDNEAVRVISSMPKWQPGTQNGKLIEIQYLLPVRFALK